MQLESQRSMKTRHLMGASALFLGVLGVGATFLPQELLGRLGAAPGAALVLLVQLLGALCLGSAMQNWMSRDNRIGGIYNRPLALANFVHFAIGVLTFVKALPGREAEAAILAIAALYALFAVWFGFVLFTTPRPPDGA